MSDYKDKTKADLWIEDEEKSTDEKSETQIIRPDKEIFHRSENLIKLFKTHYNVTETQDKFEKELIILLNDRQTDHDRILYSVITEYIYSLHKNAELKLEIEKKRSITKEMVLKYPDNSKELAKLYDHISLALNQGNWVATKSQQEATSKMIKKSDDKLKELDKEIRKPATDLVSILGIFTGIAFITFGGISLVDNLMNMAGSGASMRKVVVGILLIGFILINAIVICMQYIQSIIFKEVEVFDLIYKVRNNKEQNEEDIKKFWIFNLGLLFWIDLFFTIFVIVIYYFVPGR